ncbi:MAG: DUF3109 family protein [Bacteroidales bacterium]|nr:DUF3109 family protein [Bacteroidales bacterium]
MEYDTIIEIGDCLVSSEILTEYFACDYGKCRGCCCIIGDSGAPLDETEPEAIEKNYKLFSPLMSEAGRAAVRAKGFFEIDRDGDMVTPLVKDGEECAYCHFDSDGNCFCSMERKWFQGEGNFRKPISCWLYPIRVSTLSNGMRALNLHRWDICRDAFRKGKEERVRVYQFLREPMERYFGEDFYAALCEAAKMMGVE